VDIYPQKWIQNMRFFHPLDEILDSRPKNRILRFLVETGADMSGLQLAKLLKMSPTTVHKAMNELMAEQVIRMRAVGRAHSFRLNEASWVVAKVIRPMFAAETGFLKDLKQAISAAVRRSSLGKEILSLALFGSIHDKNEAPESDIDLFVVVKSAAMIGPVERMLSEAGGSLMPGVGMIISPFVVSLEEFKKKYKAGASLVRSAVGAHDMIFGEPLERLL
jgi:DNA-binding Lrp family transcriptional regulator